MRDKELAGIPGGYVPSKNCLSLSHGCVEHKKTSFEVLTCSNHARLYWEKSSNGKVPPNAVEALHQYYDAIYVGRTCTPLTQARKPDRRCLIASVPEHANDGPVLGKVHPSHRCLYVAISGYEYNFSEYEVLCLAKLPLLTHSIPSLFSWVEARGGEVPCGAFPAGMTSDGEVTYVARARIEGKDVPGQLTPSKRCCQVSYATTERKHTKYQVLVAEDQAGFYWKLDSQGHLPKGSVPGSEQEEILGIGRTITGSDISIGQTYRGIAIRLHPTTGEKNVQLVGKIHPSHRCLYVPHDGLEYIYREYEVLLAYYQPKSLQELCRNLVLKVTYGAPACVERLPLPRGLQQYCLLTEQEKANC